MRLKLGLVIACFTESPLRFQVLCHSETSHPQYPLASVNFIPSKMTTTQHPLPANKKSANPRGTIYISCLLFVLFLNKLTDRLRCYLGQHPILVISACAKSLQSRPTLCDPMDSSLPGDFPGKNTGAGCHVLFQGSHDPGFDPHL